MDKRGQSIIEYALITLLVILGVFFMGPYVLRSIDAHFKLWDEDVHDSFTENITQAPDSVIPPMPINCTCTDTPGTCGSTLVGATCPAFQRFINHTCSIQGCDGEPATSCVNDPTCCTSTKVGCGSVPLDQSPTATNCNYGNAIMEQICGANSTIQCVPDGTCPLPACLGIVTANFQPCPNSPGTTGAPTLEQNYALNFVAKGACTAGTPCQYFCTLGTPNGALCQQPYYICPKTTVAIAGIFSEQGCVGQVNGPGTSDDTNVTSTCSILTRLGQGDDGGVPQCDSSSPTPCNILETILEGQYNLVQLACLPIYPYQYSEYDFYACPQPNEAASCVASGCFDLFGCVGQISAVKKGSPAPTCQDTEVDPGFAHNFYSATCVKIPTPFGNLTPVYGCPENLSSGDVVANSVAAQCFGQLAWQSPGEPAFDPTHCTNPTSNGGFGPTYACNQVQ